MFKRFRKLISFFSPFPVLTWRPRRAFMPSHRSVYLYCQCVMSSLPKVSLSLTPLGFWCSCLLRCPQVPAGTNSGLGRRQLSTRGSGMFLLLDAQFCLCAGHCYGSCGVPRDMAKQQSPQSEGCGRTESERLILCDQCVVSVLNCCLAFPPTPQLFQHSTMWLQSFLCCFSFWWFRWIL